MSTISTRLQLLLPAYDEAADVDVFNNNWGILDTTSGLVLCTEATKPTVNLFQGFYIKCTDSGKHYLYLGNTWVEDTYTSTTVITLAGSSSVFYGARMSRPYSIGATSGDHTPSINVAAGTDLQIGSADTGINTGDGRGLQTTFVTTSTYNAEIEFSAHVGPIAAYPTAYPIEHSEYGILDESHFASLRFDLYRNGVFFATLGRFVPAPAGTANSYGHDILTKNFFTLNASTYNFSIKAHTENIAQGGLSSGLYLGIYDASFKVTLNT